MALTSPEPIPTMDARTRYDTAVTAQAAAMAAWERAAEVLSSATSAHTIAGWALDAADVEKEKAWRDLQAERPAITTA